MTGVQTCALPISSKLGELSQRTLRRWLMNWVEAGVIERLGQGRATRYRSINTEVDAAQHFAFLNSLDKDLKYSLLNQLRDLWTHHSTAIEGNTLTLGDTHFVLEEGLTISGKSLKDHEEIIGHAKAIELLYKSLREALTEEFLFELHKAVLTEHITDVYKPVGAWKIETNGSYAISKEGKQTFIEYALPVHTPGLMSELIDFVNNIDVNELTVKNAHHYYAKIHMGFAHIHPFWDGDGRMARLIANVPLLKAGLPPLVISQEKRRIYIQTLAEYQINTGQLDTTSTVWPDSEQLKSFEDFCQSAYATTRELIENAYLIQKKRTKSSS